jgi:hypothetical protein
MLRATASAEAHRQEHMMRELFAGRRRLTSLTAAACVLLGSAVVQAATVEPAAAVPGLHTVYADSGPLSSRAYTQDAVCPAGEQVVGGGGVAYREPFDRLFLTASYPLADGRTWRVRAAKEAPGWDGTWHLSAYAICAAPLWGWEVQRGNSGPGSAAFKTTYTFECSKGKKVLSAGGRVNAPDGSVGLTMIRPDGPLTIGRASARVAHAGFGDSWSVDSFAICAFPPDNLQNSGVIAKGDESVFWNCPGTTTAVGVGGGGGLVDLGPYYLMALAPGAGQRSVYVLMTGLQDGGTMAQVTCSD